MRMEGQEVQGAGRTGTLDITRKSAISKPGVRPCTYADFLIHEVPGHLDLLGNAPDGENPQAGVGVGRGVPLQLHVRAGLLVYAFDVLAACGQEHRGQRSES